MNASSSREPSTVSILMSVRNEERYVSAAIESMMRQSFTGFEFIVVNDGSTDDTGSIISEYAEKDERIHILSGEGRGLAVALNLGLRHAQGELIARMDGDDIACPERLEMQVAWMRANPEVLALGTSVYLIDDAGKKIRTRRMPTDPAEIARKLPVRNTLCHPTAVIRTEALNAAGGYRERFKTAEDYDLWLRLSGHGMLANLPEPLLCYRKHGGRTSDPQNRARTTVYSVAAAADHFGRMIGDPQDDAPIDVKCPVKVAQKLEALLQSALSVEFKRLMIRHVLRFLRYAEGVPADRAASLRSAAREYLTIRDRLKAMVYGV